MSKRGENIYKRKDGRWEGRYKSGYKQDGTAKYISIYGKCYADVKKRLSTAKSLLEIQTTSCCLTVTELFTNWLLAIRHKVKESTYVNYKMKMEKHIFPFLGRIKYENLTAEKITDFLDYLMTDGRGNNKGGLSAKYASDILSLIKTVCKYAYKQYGYINAAENVSYPKPVYKEDKPSLNADAVSVLTKALTDNIDNSKLGVLISLYCGLRIGELCALKWSDIDFKNNVININGTLQRIKNTDGGSATKVILLSPKSKSSQRTIPIPDFLSELLLRFKSHSNCYVLSGKENYVEPRTMQYRFKSLLKKANLPSVNFHILRHTFATNCIAVGFDTKTLSSILGHSSVEITLNCYVHSSLERKRQCMKLLKMP